MNDDYFDMTDQRDRVGADEAARHSRYRDAWTAYYGDLKKPLRVKAGQPDDNVLVNYVRLAVDTKSGFLFGAPGREIKFSTDADENDLNRTEFWLEGCWQFNRKMTTLQAIALNGQVCGNAYVRVHLPRPGEAFPRLVVLDPAIVTPVWSHDDVTDVYKWIIQYEATNERGHVVEYRQIIERNEAGRWLITDASRDKNRAAWREAESVLWPFAWSPVHHCQNYVDPNVFWGMSDIEPDVIALNKSINFALSNISRILRFHAHPKTWGKGFNADQLKIAVDEVVVLTNADASLQNLEMVSNLDSSIAFYEALRTAMRQITAVPEVALGGIDDASRVSSLALKVLYGPLLASTERKRITYGEMLSQLNSHLLEIGNLGAGTAVRNVWPHMLPEDPYTQAQTMLLDQQLGASQETTLRQRGYNPTEEKMRKEQETLNMGDALLGAFERGELGNG